MWYISGPISASSPAQEEANKAQFYRVANRLKTMGRTIINPCDLDRGCDVRGWEWEDYIARDLELIARLRPSLYMMKRWQISRGARLEHALARFLKLPIEYEV